jgi:RNA recognition motif-containing protein
MSKKLYVGNLPFSATDSDLLNVFQQQGDVLSARVVVDRETGRSKGFGFVEMSSDDEATTAVTELNGKPFMGRTLTVNEARPREEGGGGGGGRHDGRGGGGGGRRGFGGGGGHHHRNG